MNSSAIESLITKAEKIKLDTNSCMKRKYSKSGVNCLITLDLSMVSQSTDQQISEEIEIANKRFHLSI